MSTHTKPSLSDVDLNASLSDEDEYKKRLKVAQYQMLLIQRHLYETKRSAVILFEGWDGAGKGGSIRRLVERLDPRGYAVHPIGAPTEDERRRHYLQRFWVRMPAPGTISIFDRSWYGRVLVERVEKLCPKERWERAYKEIEHFERLLVDDGVPVLKFFLHISPEEQLKRFKEREHDPFKVWKITDEDWRNRDKWEAYAKVTEEMFQLTSTDEAPWHLIASERKWLGRVQVVEAAAKALGRFFDVSISLPAGWKPLRD